MRFARSRPPPANFCWCISTRASTSSCPQVDGCLRQLDIPVVIYGTPYRGKVDNLDFRAPSNEWFVHDLAHCRAVLCTAGNQLTGEAIHLGKPSSRCPKTLSSSALTRT